MDPGPERESWEAIAELLAARDARQLEAFLDTLPPAELARAVSRLGDDDQAVLFDLLTPADAADLIEDVPDAQAVDLIEEMPAARAAAVIGAMPAHERADLLGELDEEQAEAVLDAMEPGAAREARQLLRYDPETAGGLMVTDLLSYRDDLRVAEVLEDLRRHGEAYSDYEVQYGYVTDAAGKLRGVLRLRDLLFTPRERSVVDAMLQDPVCVRADASLEDLQQLFAQHEFLGVPVTGPDGTLLGVVQRSAVRDATGEAANRTFLQASGIVGGEELRSMPLATRTARRLGWLSINILLNVVAASVIAFYQDTLEKAITLAVFLPIISDMSGCSGNQAVAVSIRELSLGLVRPAELARVLAKESVLGVLNGIVLGGLLGGAAVLWKGNPYLGLVVGTALALNTVVAVSLGGALPLILRRFGADPALVSGPVLTTITDMCGFFLVLKLASLLLSRLV